MKAIIQRVYGSADVLELRDVPIPVAGDNEVVVKVEAAGIDTAVLHLMTGRPLAMRLAGYGLRTPKQRIPGMAFAGRITELGSSVTSLSIGDPVYGVAQGAFADFARARVDRIAPAPKGLTPIEAAALPISATTALKAVRDTGSIKTGQRVLVIGASGSVGSYAVQIARAFDAEVTGVCSTGKIEFVRSLGAKEVVDYTIEDLTRFTGQFDLVIDTGGGRSLKPLRRLLNRKGSLVIVGADGVGGALLGGADRQWRASIVSLFVPQRMSGLMSVDTTAALNELTNLVVSRKLSPKIDRVFPLNDAASAVKYVENRGATGKVIISI